MTERVLITGGAGFVGLHLARRLLTQGAEVVLLDDFSRGRRDDELLALQRHVTVVEHDLSRPLPDDLLSGSFDGVYHLAGVVGVARATQYPAQVLNVNLRAALHVLDWCRRRQPGAVFLSSTSEVADGAAALGLVDFPTSEDGPFALAAPARPRASYALSKLVAEVLFRQCAHEFRVRVGRYHNIYGPRMGYEHVIPEFIERGLGRLDPFPLYGATQTRAFCYIDDAVEATVALMRLGTDEAVVANIGNDEEEIEIRRLADRVVALCGYSPAMRVFDAPSGSPQRRLPDLTVLREATGYRPKVPLDEGLRLTHAWYAAHRTPAEGRR
ncbi:MULTISPECIES: NAD-dependent epimerase/dehydratase family protein [Streptomyces]|uniref:Nucleoside-diphosphate sugar epimerase n=1 Tax=Streptomyces canarius TaxID=285453 RepID=A0ABQ3D201_9ACTN|nr:NAD-dependent epimerase/dehydratase family protein [Streptomyces canarius]GHA52154.1 nucleoside-diphosphate sugar epimerase [Streptomyces canarius]